VSLAAAMRGDDVLRGVVGPVPGPDGAVRGVGGEWQHERVTTSAPAMIGRDADLAMLNERLAEVRAGAPFTVIIGGEAGIGKTRLIREFEAGLPDDVRLLAGQSVDLGSVAAPYAPVKTALRTLLAETESQRVQTAAALDKAKADATKPAPEKPKPDATKPDKTTKPKAKAKTARKPAAKKSGKKKGK